jgi:antitoxin component YwqK of YwqJK toxin-antitoxin module
LWHNKNSVLIEKGNDQLEQRGTTLYYQQEPFTGIIFSVTHNSDTLTKEIFLNGKENGVSKVWDSQGNKLEERMYADGKRVGIHKGWHPNGKLKFQYAYKNDFMDGLAAEWFADGKKYREMNYIKGHEEGMQRMWAEDGTIRANYEARNGRNYGLTGIKSCKNIWPDVAL